MEPIQKFNKLENELKQILESLENKQNIPEGELNTILAKIEETMGSMQGLVNGYEKEVLEDQNQEINFNQEKE